MKKIHNLRLLSALDVVRPNAGALKTCPLKAHFAVTWIKIVLAEFMGFFSHVRRLSFATPSSHRNEP